MSEVNEKDFNQIKKELGEGTTYIFTVITGSMLPLISPGTKIEVVNCDHELSKYEIVVFWDGHRLICHYVLQLNKLRGPTGEKVYITRGLNAPGVDLPVPEKKILGVVKSHRISWMLKLREFFKNRK